MIEASIPTRVPAQPVGQVGQVPYHLLALLYSFLDMNNISSKRRNDLCDESWRITPKVGELYALLHIVR